MHGQLAVPEAMGCIAKSSTSAILTKTSSIFRIAARAFTPVQRRLAAPQRAPRAVTLADFLTPKRTFMRMAAYTAQEEAPEKAQEVLETSAAAMETTA